MSSISRFSILWRKIIHNPLVKLSRLSVNRTIKVVRNDFKPDGKPTVYAATHVFYNDIVCVLCSIKSSAWLLYGGYNDKIAFSEKLALFLNGKVQVKRWDGTDRAAALDVLTRILKKRGDVLFFPEGAWNLTPNLPVQKIWLGAVKAARDTGANLVPIAVDIVDNEYCVIIGEAFDARDYQTKIKTAEVLRDRMATLRWELSEMKPPLSRANIKPDCWVDFCVKERAKTPWDKQEIEEKYIFRPKGEISLGEVLAEIHGIEYRGMAADYERFKLIEMLIDKWNTPFKG